VFRLKLTVESMISFTLIAMMISAVYAQPPPTLLWSHWIPLEDIAVSEDGQYVANVDGTGKTLRFYSRDGDGTPLWSWSAATDSLLSVAISEHGDYLAVGSNYRVYYWINAKNRGSSPDKNPTWQSVAYGRIDRRCLDISDDGDYVLAGSKGFGSYPNVLYWAGATSKSGSSISCTWGYPGGGGFSVNAVDLSSDGDYVAAGETGHSVAYWKNAKTEGNLDWMSTKLESALDVVDVAVSDDGNYVAAVSHSVTGALYYWAGAKALASDPSATWYHELWAGPIFTSIDMSSDGDKVIAGGTLGVYFWSGATALTGKPEDPSWTYATLSLVEDVAVNNAGDYMAAANDVVTPYVYFFDSGGHPLWDQPYLLDAKVVSISLSGDGGTLAVGTVGSSAHLFDTGFRTPTPAPVGGILVPVNKLEVLAPCLALVGLVGALTAAIAIRRRKP